MSLHNINTATLRKLTKDLPASDGLDRLSALESFTELGFPHARMEKWQKSVIRKFVVRDFDLVGEIDSGTNRIAEQELPWSAAGTLVFHNGMMHASSLIQDPRGFVFGSLSAAMKQMPDLVNQHLNRYADERLNGLTAMNNALFRDGFFLYVPAGMQLDTPFVVQSLSGTESRLNQMRNLVVIGDNASATVIQIDGQQRNANSFNNNVSEVYVGSNGEFNWYREQAFGQDEALVNSVFCQQERDARTKFLMAAISGQMIRNEVRVKLNGENGQTDVFGLYMPQSGEQVDNQVFVDHAVPHCVSNELFKGVLDGNGSSVFNGHILVRQDAQKTNAYQTNRNILLSDEADAYAKPFLEIYADDVRCSHGATVGQLDEDALFYLRSRGLKEQKARGFLIRAFLGEVLDHCEHEEFRNRLEGKVNLKLLQA